MRHGALPTSSVSTEMPFPPLHGNSASSTERSRELFSVLLLLHPEASWKADVEDSAPIATTRRMIMVVKRAGSCEGMTDLRTRSFAEADERIHYLGKTRRT